MGYDLKPRNKSIGGLNMGGSWVWMLNSGVGLPLGFGEGIEPAQFVYKTRPDGLCIGDNSGAKIKASEAKMMAKIARWVADYQDTLYSIWMDIPEHRRDTISNRHDNLYNVPVRRDFIEKVREFADWAEKSRGFSVK